MKVPFLDLPQQFAPLRKDILERWDEILVNASFIGGEYVEQFEEQFAAACCVKHAVFVASGTDALLYILLALGVGKGDEILVPVNTFIATAEAVSHCGATPVFVDIDPLYYTIDPQLIEQAITEKTKGIIAVHLYGHPAEMDTITHIADQRRMWVIEDACQAHLAEYKQQKIGTLSVAGAFSFYPGKNLGGCGEGGAVTTNNEEIAEKVRKLRDHGQGKKYYHEMIGYNGRCDALQAAALSVKLQYLEEWNKTRRHHAQHYSSLLALSSNLTLPAVAEDVLPVFHLYVILVKNRNAVQQQLAERGIATALHYPVPLHLQHAYAYLGYREGDFPVAEQCAAELLSLPMFPELVLEQIQYVCENLMDIISNE